MVHETPNQEKCGLESLPFRLLLAGVCPQSQALPAACGEADPCWNRALHPSFSTLTPLQGLELPETGRVSLPNTEEEVLQ